MGRVAGKVAIVTGGSSGLGKAAVTALVAEGAEVFIADIAKSAGEALAATLGDKAHFIEHDVTQESAWQQLIESVVKRAGKLDILVNNAGIVVVASIEETSYAQLKQVQAVNIDGPFLGCKHAIPALAASGGGSIINIASTGSILGFPPYAAYCTSKGAVRALTQTVAVHCKTMGYNIRCNSLHPGAMDTPMVAALTDTSRAGPQALQLMAKLGAAAGEPIGTPADVAAAVVYFASDESRFVSGAQLTIDNAVTIS